MRIVFAGTPEFAATALAAIVEAGLQVVLVLSQPDRPAGRGLKLVPSPVRRLALAHRIEVATPQSLSMKRGGEAAVAAHALLRAARADVMVVAAYGLILPQAVLDIPAGLPDAGCGRIKALNIHGSLLPRWRGAAPVARAIEAGDEATGITIMQMDAGLDTGPTLLAESTPIRTDDSAASPAPSATRSGSTPAASPAARGSIACSTWSSCAPRSWAGPRLSSAWMASCIGG